jgi:hypothetical protein
VWAGAAAIARGSTAFPDRQQDSEEFKVDTLKGRLEEVQSRLARLKAEKTENEIDPDDRQRLTHAAQQSEALHEDLEALELLGANAVMDLSIVIEQGLTRLEQDVREVEARLAS